MTHVAATPPTRRAARYVLPVILLAGAQAFGFLEWWFPGSLTLAGLVLLLFAGAAVLLFQIWRHTGRAGTRILAALALGGTTWFPLWTVVVLAAVSSDVWLLPGDGTFELAIVAPVAVAACWRLTERSEPGSTRHRLAAAGLTVSVIYLVGFMVVLPAVTHPPGEWQ